MAKFMELNRAPQAVAVSQPASEWTPEDFTANSGEELPGDNLVGFSPI